MHIWYSERTLENLKAGIRIHGVDITDKVWFTCCALHNLLLDVDGLNQPWDGKLGLHDLDEGVDNITFALQRLENQTAIRNYDSSGMGPGFVNSDDEDEVDEYYPQINDEIASGVGNGVISQNTVNNLKNISSTDFRGKLIKHFDILFREHKVK